MPIYKSYANLQITNIRCKLQRFAVRIIGMKFADWHHGGFTILETLIAISIFTVAVLGPLNLATYSIRLASYSRHQTIAFYLAEEAIEYIRNKRDSNALAVESWLEGLNDCLGADGCYIDVAQGAITLRDGDWKKIKFDSSDGFYDYSSGDDTVFIRKTWIEQITADEAKVKIEMSWKERFLDKSFVVEEYIYDWK